MISARSLDEIVDRQRRVGQAREVPIEIALPRKRPHLGFAAPGTEHPDELERVERDRQLRLAVADVPRTTSGRELHRGKTVRRVWRRVLIDPSLGTRKARVRRHLPLFQWSNPSIKDHLALFTHGVVGQWSIPRKTGRASPQEHPSLLGGFDMSLLIESNARLRVVADRRAR